MLKGIPKILPPELLKIMSEMGHGDEIVIADGNFPSETIGQRVVRLDGHGASEVLSAMMKFLPLDSYAEQNVLLMQVVPGDNVVPVIWEEYKKIVAKEESGMKLGNIERFAFYERAKRAYAVVATGEGALYANIIIKKGVIK